MNRRSFFRTMIGGVAAAAAVRTWPFRVYSFPSEIEIPAKEIIEVYGPMDVHIAPRVIRGMLDPRNMAILEATRKRLPVMFEPFEVKAFAFDHNKYQRTHGFGELEITVLEPERRPIRVR